MNFEPNKSEEELKSIFRDYLNSKPIEEEDAASIIEQVKLLKNSNDIQLKMISRALLGKIETLFPGKFDMSFINDSPKHESKKEPPVKKVQVEHPEAFMIQSNSELSGPFTKYQLRQMWSTGQINLSTTFVRPCDKSPVLIDDVLTFLEENQEKKNTNSEPINEVSKTDTQPKKLGCLGCFIYGFVLFFLASFIVGIFGPEKEYNDSFSAHIMAEGFVKKNLKVPDSANFCDYSECKISVIASNTWLVEGWVESKNLFGVTLRKNYKNLLMYKGQDRWSSLGVEFSDP